MKSSVRILVALLAAASLVGMTMQACSASNEGSGAGGIGANGQGGSGATTGIGASGGLDPGTDGSVGGGCAEASSDATAAVLPADVILAVDNSGSMEEESSLVQVAMNDFASIIVNSGIDVHIILISADSTMDEGICVPLPLGSGACPNDENLPTYRHVVQTVQSSDSLDLILSTYPQWQSSLRPGASRTIAVISDDNASLGSAAFTQQLVALDASFQGFKFDAIVAPYEVANPFLCLNCPAPCDCDPCCGANSDPFPACIDLPADEGVVYKELVAQTQGVLGDLCTQDFLPVFHDMATAVISESEIACTYYIPDPGNGETIDVDRVNVNYYADPNAPAQAIYYVPGGVADCGPEGGWYYDDPNNPTQIIFCEATCQAVQLSETGRVSVVFGCETITT